MARHNKKLNEVTISLSTLRGYLPETVIQVDEASDNVFDPQTGNVRGPDGTSYDVSGLGKPIEVVILVNEHGQVHVRHEADGPVLTSVLKRELTDGSLVTFSLKRVSTGEVEGGDWMDPKQFVNLSQDALSVFVVAKALTV